MVVSSCNNWQSSKLRVETDPSTTEELVKDVVLLSISEEET